MSTADNVDIIEDTIRQHGDLLEILLTDRTRTTARKVHHIIWATESYPGHKPKSEIAVGDITGVNRRLIQPRIAKSRAEQKARTKDKAEVFTPPAIVDRMNKLTDANGSPNWPVTSDNWQNYVGELRLEITCGEAPFIVGRYNAVNGTKVLDLKSRVGFLDRKLRVVSEYCHNQMDWLKWATVAYQSSYGYEWQGDNLLLARENLLYTFVDYWNDKFPNETINLDDDIQTAKMSILNDIATIISWNIFQMDGIKYVIPMSCKSDIKVDNGLPLLVMTGDDEDKISKNICPGCRTGDPFRHNGKYAKIMDWRKGNTVKFVDVLS